MFLVDDPFPIVNPLEIRLFEGGPEFCFLAMLACLFFWSAFDGHRVMSLIMFLSGARMESAPWTLSSFYPPSKTRNFES